MSKKINFEEYDNLQEKYDEELENLNEETFLNKINRRGFSQKGKARKKFNPNKKKIDLFTDE